MDERDEMDVQESPEAIEAMPFSDIDQITPEEAEDRIVFADELRDLAADIIAGRVRNVLIFKYEHDDPHSLFHQGFMESQGAQKHMYQDIAEACENALDIGAFSYVIGGIEDEA